MTFIIENWEYFFLGFYILEKIVKVTPCTWDDILVDSIKKGWLKWKNTSGPRQSNQG